MTLIFSMHVGNRVEIQRQATEMAYSQSKDTHAKMEATCRLLDLPPQLRAFCDDTDRVLNTLESDRKQTSIQIYERVLHDEYEEHLGPTVHFVNDTFVHVKDLIFSNMELLTGITTELNRFRAYWIPCVIFIVLTTVLWHMISNMLYSTVYLYRHWCDPIQYPSHKYCAPSPITRRALPAPSSLQIEEETEEEEKQVDLFPKQFYKFKT